MKHVLLCLAIGAYCYVLVPNAAIAGPEPESGGPASLGQGSTTVPVIDPEAVARGKKLAREACAAMLGPGQACRFEIMAVPEMSVDFNEDHFTVYASPSFLKLVADDDELRAAFAWSTIPGDPNLEGLEKALYYGRIGVDIAVGAVALTGILFLSFEYGAYVSGDGVGVLLILILLPADAVMRITNLNTLDMTRSSLLSSKDRKTMKALAKSGYDSNSMIRLLHTLHQAEEETCDTEPLRLISLLKIFYGNQDWPDEGCDPAMGKIDDYRIATAKDNLRMIESLIRN